MSMDSSAPVYPGLEGVIVAETCMSRVDGQRGQLVVGGHDIRDLVDRYTFEDVCGLLWHAKLPDRQRRAAIAQAIADGRERAFASLDGLGDALTGRGGPRGDDHPQAASPPAAMDGLRTAMSHWRPGGSSFGHNAAEVAGAMAVFAAAWWRRAAGQEPVAPNRSLSLAADYLRMLRGQTPQTATSRALDSYFVTVADHGMNASTFAARVITSTGSDMVSAVVAALGALKGPLHGGAPGPVLDMLDEIGSIDRAHAWLDRELGEGRRIMGMGHRVYRTRDPRAAVLERVAKRLCQSRNEPAISARLSLARSVEECAQECLERRHPGRILRANVEFYTAVLLNAVGIDRRLFSPTFAIARSAGWCGHIGEQRKSGRLIRPKSRYVGPLHMGG